MTRRGLLLAGGTALGATSGAIAIDRRASAHEAAAEAAFPPEGRLLDVNGIKVHAVIRGSGPDLVMIHGASGNSRDFTYRLIARLSERYRCIAFDRPGLGYTDRTDPAYDDAFASRAESPGQQATLLAAAHSRLSDSPPLVLGHSFGGTVALAWALDHPARALALVSPAAVRWKGGLGALYAVNASALGGSLAVPLLSAFVTNEQLRRIVEGIFAPDAMPEGYFAHVGAQLTLRRVSLRSNARQVNGLKPHITAIQARYSELSLPIEWIHGTADTIVPPDVHAHPYKALMPSTNLTMIDGAGHMPHHSDPDAIIAAIARAAARAT